MTRHRLNVYVTKRQLGVVWHPRHCLRSTTSKRSDSATRCVVSQQFPWSPTSPLKQTRSLPGFCLHQTLFYWAWFAVSHCLLAARLTPDSVDVILMELSVPVMSIFFFFVWSVICPYSWIMWVTLPKLVTHVANAVKNRKKQQEQNKTTNTEFPVWVPSSVGRFNFANWMIDLLILISHTFTLTSSRLKHSLLASVSYHPPCGCLFRFFHTWTAKKSVLSRYSFQVTFELIRKSGALRDQRSAKELYSA